jgi:hypothetical protein
MTRPADALLIEDLVTENESLRRDIISVYTDLQTVREVLSISLEHVHALTRRCEDQTDQIKRLMGLHEDTGRMRRVVVDPWYPTPEQAAAAVVPGMVKGDEIRWTLE